MVPSTSLTIAVSDLGPESSTERMDLAESFRMMSNSSEVIERASALDAAGSRRRAEEAVKRLVSRLRRCIILWFLEFDGSSSWQLACSFVLDDVVRGEEAD